MPVTFLYFIMLLLLVSDDEKGEKVSFEIKWHSGLSIVFDILLWILLIKSILT